MPNSQTAKPHTKMRPHTNLGAVAFFAIISYYLAAVDLYTALPSTNTGIGSEALPVVNQEV